ncbi:hypothetical protein BRADI_2g48422v3 [Brachypodium distachyon]|uniref:Uncharacterized protein n=1 Tax=Brachypodium distachyon TaxID=15368 RepID=A0A2K2DER3_BRADI|nr:hypothetical protein BRADI_2g48422v3 [Brachypodium distachyon]
MARLTWTTVHSAFNISPPNNMAHILGAWLQGIDKTLHPLILVGAAAVFWSIWLCLNDIVFYKKKIHSCMQVLLLCTNWLRLWALLQKVQHNEPMESGAKRLEWITRSLFSGLDAF